MPDTPTRLMIVEDQEITRFGLRLALANHTGVEVVGEAADGPSSVEAARSLKPDVILMDIGLPGFDGIEAARQVRQLVPESRIIMFTSHDSPDEVFAALSVGAEGYCLKNIAVDQLARAVQSVHQGVVWLDPGIASSVLRSLSAPPSAAASTAKAISAKDGSLSPREMEVLALIVEGLSNQEIAERLVVSPETVKTHVRHVMEKLAVSDRTQAAVKALREGLV